MKPKILIVAVFFIAAIAQPAEPRTASSSRMRSQSDSAGARQWTTGSTPPQQPQPHAR